MIILRADGPHYHHEVKAEMRRALQYFRNNSERVYIGKCFLMIERIIKDRPKGKCKNTQFLIMEYENYDTKCLKLIVGGGFDEIFMHKYRLTNAEPERYDFWKQFYEILIKFGKVVFILISAALMPNIIIPALEFVGVSGTALEFAEFADTAYGHYSTQRDIRKALKSEPEYQSYNY